MFTQLSDGRKALAFYGLALGLAIANTALAPILDAGVLLSGMFTPLLAVALMLLVVTRDGYTRQGWMALGLHRPGFCGWGLALLAPLLILLLSYGAVWSAGLVEFAIPPQARPLPLLPIKLLISIALGAFMGVLGEEVGYRGYLQPRLLSLGPRRAMLLTGLLHGVWHLPVMLLTPFYHAAGNPVSVIPLFLMTLTLAGVLYGYLRQTTGSVWPAIIAHRAFNVYWTQLIGFVVVSSRLATEYLAGESGLLTLLGTAVVAVWLASRLRERQGMPRLQPVRGI